MGWPTVLSAIIVIMMSLWTSFLIYEYYQKTKFPSTNTALGLLCHTIPAWSLYLTCHLASTAINPFNTWFVFLLAFRYWRTAVNIYFWFQYKPAVTAVGEKLKVTPSMVTVIIPTVGPYADDVFEEMVTAVLVNGPDTVIFSANTVTATEDVKQVVPGYIAAIAAGTTKYQAENGLGPMDVKTKIEYVNALVSNKRRQVVQAFSLVNTPVIAMADDTAIWHPRFLSATLPAFNDPSVGFIGTRKWVKRIRPAWDPTFPLLTNLTTYYHTAFWNTIGALYLIRHNFEIRATNAADGGVFCVSGRSSLIRSSIVKDPSFIQAFLHEHFLRFPGFFEGFGPVKADDDNFLTRHVLDNGWKIKIQCSDEATMTTTLGTLPLKFHKQCVRWSRSTFRQNPMALFIDRTVWIDWPLTVWTTYFPWMYNAALIWDPLTIYTFMKSDFYQNCTHLCVEYPKLRLTALILFIQLTKLVKTIPWFWAHPLDFLLFFVIPAYPLFAYAHSLLKIYSMFTCWDCKWLGRELPTNEVEVEGKEE